MSGTVPFDPQQIIARLVAEGVDFVVIGGVAATLQGAELPTLDLDIVYERCLVETIPTPCRSLPGRTAVSAHSWLSNGAPRSAVEYDAAALLAYGLEGRAPGLTSCCVPAGIVSG